MEESPDNTGHRSFERKGIREGAVVQQKITSRFDLLNRVKVKRWGKSPPGLVATPDAVYLTGCKAMYTDALGLPVRVGG